MLLNRALVSVAGSILLVGVSAFAQQPPKSSAKASPQAKAAAITNGDVVSLVKAGFNDDLVIARIQQASTKAFDLSTEGMVALKSAGVSQRLIAFMLTGVDPGSLATTRSTSSAAASLAPAPTAVVTITAGTEIKLRLTRTLSSAEVKTGESVTLAAADDVVINGEVVIKKDSPAWGKITRVTSQRLTRAGSVEFSIDSVKAVNSAEVKLSGGHSAKAGRGLVTANELILESGLVLTAKVADDQPISISAMGKATENPSTSTAEPSKGSTPAPLMPLSTTSVEGREAGIYFKDGEKMIQIEPSVFSGGKTGSLLVSGLTYGVKKAKWKAVVRSARAAQRIQTVSPEFYFYFETRGSGLSNTGGLAALLGASSPNEFVLAKMDRADKQRELTVGEFGVFGATSGTSSHDTIDLTIEKLGPGVYKVTPKEPLKAREEYCFFYAAGASQFAAAGNGKLFDFGID